MAPPRVAVLFNAQLECLLKDLILIYPEDADFKACLFYSQTLSSTAPRKPLELFQVYVAGPYREGILQKNEAMFLETRYTDSTGVEFNVVPKLKQYWKTMTEENKTVVWNYLFLLLALLEEFLKNGESF